VDIDLPHVVRGTMELLRAAAEAKGLKFSAMIAPDVPPALRADGGRLRQVLINLLGNAIKFTASGEVKLDVALERQTDESATLHFRIVDTGIGISPATQAKLFQAFTQADGSTTRQFGGTGLGLVISRQLVEKMRGTLSVESAAGAGSIFSFTVEFPKQPNPMVRELASNSSSAGADPVLLRAHRVLIAEDNLVNQRVASAQLQKLGYNSDIVANGLEVMEALRWTPYDIILMDCQMPEMDGYEATRRLRKKAGHQPYIIAMTAHAMQGDREISLNAGMNDYITKPVRTQELETALSKAPKISGPGEGLETAA
jgi:CheY-like chemotaxis protein